MNTIPQLIDIFLHLDKHLSLIVSDYGQITYFILFLIIFCETGLVVTPFLPGDSLLFAAGAITATSTLNINFLFILLLIAAITGDALNYFIGSKIGLSVFEKKDSKIFKKEYLRKTQQFYEKYGGKTIVIARFVPIIRTFAPFLAGVGNMRYRNFALYNIVGGFLWVFLFLFAGYYFGNQEFVKKNFSLVIVAIIIISILPAVFEFIKERKKGKAISA
jgi:membrane-associated protein